MKKLFLMLLCAVVCALAQNRTTFDQIQQAQLTLISDAGGDDAYVGCPTIQITALAVGTPILLVPTTSNTDGATINPCSQGVKNIVQADNTTLVTGALKTAGPNLLVYDGTSFRHIASGSGGTTYTNSDGFLSISGSVINVTPGAFMEVSGTNTPDGSFDFSGVSSWYPPQGSSDPATCSASPRQWFFNTTSNVLKYCSSTNVWTALSGSSSYDPLDTSVFTMVEEFIAANNPSGVPNYGVYGWLESVSGGTADTGESTTGASTNWADGSSISLSTSSGVNNRAAIACCGTGGNAPWYALGSNTNWESRFTFRNDAFFTDEFNIRVGFADAYNVAYPSNFIGVSFMKNTGCTNTGTDTSWKAETRSGGSSTRTAFSTPLSFTTAQIITFRIRSTSAGTILFSYRTANSAYSSETSIATTVPTSNMMPIFQIVSCNTGENHLINAMRFAFQATGLTYR